MAQKNWLGSGQIFFIIEMLTTLYWPRKTLLAILKIFVATSQGRFSDCYVIVKAGIFKRA